MLRAIAILFIFGSCSTSIRAPKKDDKDLLSPSVQIAINYRNAIENKDPNSCQNLKDLGLLQAFPLRDIAIIRSLEYCDYSREELEKIWEQFTSPKWAEKIYFSNSEKAAKNKKMKTQQAAFLSKLSDLQSTQKDQVALLQRAISLDPLTEYIDKLGLIAPRFKKKFSIEESFEVARDLENDHQIDRARNLYQKIIRSQDTTLPLKRKAYRRVALTHKIDGDKEAYAQFSEKIVRWIEKMPGFDSNIELQNAWAEESITHARSEWTINKRKKAEKILTRVSNTLKIEPRFLAQSFWILGAIEIEKKNHKKAIEYFNSAHQISFKDDELQEKVTWSLGFGYYLEKEYSKAATVFGNAIQSELLDDIRSRLTYWHAKTLAQLGEASLSIEAFEEIIEKFPFSYYSLLAHQELKRPLSPLDATQSIEKDDDTIFDWLLSVNEQDLLKEYLKSKSRNAKDDSAILNLLPLFEEGSFHEGLVSLFFRLKDENKNDYLIEYPQYAFPRPYYEEFKKGSQLAKIDQDLLFSISRQESLFDRYARSWAEAYGLMQILPRKAEIISERFSIPYKDRFSLFSPDTNIQLGAHLLAELTKKFDGRLPLAIASYNAGEGPVQTWFEERFQGDWAEFIELIPYAETQKYVKLVLRNLFIYKRMNSVDSLDISNDQLFGINN